jgi:O-antigen/teichoic acid export membrane protein
MSSFLKDISSVGISKIAIIAFSLMRGIITARWLGPEANGIIAALAVYPSLFMTFGSLGISQSATHFIGKGKYSEERITTSIAQIWIFTTVLSVVISFFLIRYFSNSGHDLILVFLAVVPIPFTLFNTYNSGIFLGKNQIEVYNRINWLPTAIAFIFVVLLVVIIPLGINGVMLSSISGPVFMFVLLLFKNDFIHAFKLKFDWKIIHSLLSLGIVYAISILVINLNYKADVILLDKLSSPFELGIYSKGVAITEYLWQIPMLLSTIIFARSASAKDGLVFSRKVAQLLRLSVISIGLGSIILVIIAKYVIVIMYGVAFMKSTQVLQLLMPGVLLLTIFKVLNMDLAGKGKPWISMKAMIPAVLLNIGLNIFLIPTYGANGSAISSTISYSFAALLFLHFYSKEVHLPVKEILRYSKSDFQPITAAYKTVLSRIK